MKKSTQTQSQKHNSNPRKKNEALHERVIVGYRLVPMQAHHVDEIDAAEGRMAWWNNVSKRPRCPKCFIRLPDGRSSHFCRWNVRREGTRDRDPKMRRMPIYEWVLRGVQGP